LDAIEKASPILGRYNRAWLRNEVRNRLLPMDTSAESSFSHQSSLSGSLQPDTASDESLGEILERSFGSSSSSSASSSDLSSRQDRPIEDSSLYADWIRSIPPSAGSPPPSPTPSSRAMWSRVREENPGFSGDMIARRIVNLADGGAVAARSWVDANEFALRSVPGLIGPPTAAQIPTPDALPEGVRPVDVQIPDAIDDVEDGIRTNEPSSIRKVDREDVRDEPDDAGDTRMIIQQVIGDDVQNGVLPLRPEFKQAGPEEVAESAEQTQLDHRLFNEFNYIPSAGQLGNADVNPLVRLNELEDAIRYMRPYRNWTGNGEPLLGIARVPRAQITINNYGEGAQARAWQRVKRQRPDFDTNQPIVQRLQNAIQLPSVGHEVFDRADYARPRLAKRVKTAIEPFSSTWEARVRALD
jgi:hypothetical protein